MAKELPFLGTHPVHLGEKSLLPFLIVSGGGAWWAGWFFSSHSKLTYLASVAVTAICVGFYFFYRSRLYKAVTFGEGTITLHFDRKPDVDIQIATITKVSCDHDGPVQIYYDGGEKSFYMSALKNRIDYKFLDYLLSKNVKFTGASYRMGQPKPPKKDF